MCIFKFHDGRWLRAAVGGVQTCLRDTVGNGEVEIRTPEIPPHFQEGSTELQRTQGQLETDRDLPVCL